MDITNDNDEDDDRMVLDFVLSVYDLLGVVIGKSLKKFLIQESIYVLDDMEFSELLESCYFRNSLEKHFRKNLGISSELELAINKEYKLDFYEVLTVIVIDIPIVSFS